jgi:hypothetical protein
MPKLHVDLDPIRGLGKIVAYLDVIHDCMNNIVSVNPSYTFVSFLEYSQTVCLFPAGERQVANQQGRYKQHRPTPARARSIGQLGMADKTGDFVYSRIESCFSRSWGPSYCDLRRASHAWGEPSPKQ